MDALNISRGQNATLKDPNVLNDLPEEILEILRLGNSPRYLDAIAAASLIPTLTIQFFTRFEPIFADTCARWISHTTSRTNSTAIATQAFARLLPFAPHLAVLLDRYLQPPLKPTQRSSRQELVLQYLSEDSEDNIVNLPDLDLQRLLLAAFRLLNFDKSRFSQAVSTSKIQSLLRHQNRPVKYLAVKIFCQLLSASDAKCEDMITEYVGKEEPISGDFDGVSIDYGFLSLYEQKRAKEVTSARKSMQENGLETTPFRPHGLSTLVSSFGNVLLPRPNGVPARPTILTATKTTSENMQNFATALLNSSPVLIHGLSGAGKTSLVNDLARELGKDSTMVTLHLNEQTDAKMLIGMYTTDSTPGSFTWRPGVMTTAIREGRWVFIEDLDRAPNEVISVILPLIERGELLIPSRSETIRAASGFRLIASIRTSLNVNGNENPPPMNMLGARLWNRVPVKMPAKEEFLQIINGTYPLLHKFLPGIIAVYERLYILFQKPSFAAKSRTSLGRPISPRDLLKWCRRLHAVLLAAGSKTGDEPITEATKDEMFMEAADCFSGSLQTEEARKSVVFSIAEEMHIPPQRVDHYLEAHVPAYEDAQTYIAIGRVKLPKKNASNQMMKASRRSRPFANTAHAKRLLEQVGVAVKMAEPVLLVGETGIGKTTVIQQLADSLGYQITAVNLSQQSEVGDLLGGFKPVNIRSLAIPLKEEFDDLFASTGISSSRNQKYLDQLGKCVAKGQWTKASKLWHEAPRMFQRILAEISKLDSVGSRHTTEQPTKRRKTESKLQVLLKLKPRWQTFSQSLDQFDVQLSGGSKGFAFSFVEGNIVKAARNGEWILLDEINLASPDTLESIADLLHSGPGSSPSILLSEKGEIERVLAHPDFRIFGAMNPATDVGKRDLPMGLRSRFSEIYVESPDRELNDLLSVIKAYLRNSSSSDERAAHDVARLYMNTKRLAEEKRLVDGANQIPHFSLRTLTRVLSFATEIAPSYGLRRALYEGYAMGFLTLLDRESEKMLMPLINHHLLDGHPNPKALLSQTPQHPNDGRQYVPFMNQKRDRHYWMLQGRETPQEQPHYIITPFVERNMLNLVRATSTRRFPVLVQGPTSSGKTSMIEYLAKHSGNKFVRINNHEHTDLQEYLGTYVSGSDGQLSFQEGLLVQALREGHWIVLDELNLAPTDVLEALNRLLDDNRELLIPETQEVVRPHENFMLFATQNPPGLYGGRKTLSRAFRNRFLELHFDDIPEDELEYILEHRSQKVAPSDCRRIVTVYKDLSRLRQSSRLFEQKDSFATLRDLFRWALRDADNRDQLAANGYMLLAERVRKTEERIAVKEIIEKVMKVKLDPKILYDVALSPEIRMYEGTENTQGVVWTHAMRRLYVLVSHALRNNEPVLLVGETGCGKTTVCQMLAEAFGKQLHIVNAHQNTETGDLIGAQRPVRNRAAIMKKLEDDLRSALQLPEGTNEDTEQLVIAYDELDHAALANIPVILRNSIQSNRTKAKALFEWSDGSLVQAMREGQFFLLDEISLADDSVLERLNSVLEPQRSLLLAEKGSNDSFVQAVDGFHFLATMNPGGDYGKRELSPALRNRFTEIWVPSLSEHEDVLQIVEAKLASSAKRFASAIVDFANWFGSRYRPSATQRISVRDILAWITFINGSLNSEPYFAILHGASMVYIDTLGANPAALLAINPDSIREERDACLHQLDLLLDHDIASVYNAQINVVNSEHMLSFGDFSIEKSPAASLDTGFAFNAPTTSLNAMRVVRALQVRKPILIEGSPGVGKTTLIVALAKATGKSLTRINLSEQTDLMDLFGSDVPVDGAEAGNFAWRDAPFLQAMQNGDWVLLDEMNLASQSVLEGLNACLDHRGEVYISELDQTFKRHPNFCVFAAQNPHHQGGGRKGLPSSFVNRFTVVYADVFRNDDLTRICTHNFPNISNELMSNVITFVSTLEDEVVYRRRFGSQGGPWEFNLRDTLRWLQLLSSPVSFLQASQPSDFLNLIFRQRFRTAKDREQVDRVFTQVFGKPVPFRQQFYNISADAFQVGMGYLPRHQLVRRLPFPEVDVIPHLPELESMMMCIQQNLPCILVGPSGCGKSALIEHAAAATGADVVIFPLNSDIDTMDLVGGFEQVDPQRVSGAFLNQLYQFLETRILTSMLDDVPTEAFDALRICQLMRESSQQLFTELHKCLLSLHEQISLPELQHYLLTCQHISENPKMIESARFEWVDGVLVKALEDGRWLVLDGANLCSSSVLDRLNSLLEPDGVLSINEHCGPDGEPKIIKPHADFRLFLTMDPRFGELSRAMRNRSIEIYLDSVVDPGRLGVTDRSAHVQIEASLQRYSNVVEALNIPNLPLPKNLLATVALDTLSTMDTALLQRFSEASQNGLISTLVPSSYQLLHRYFEATRFGEPTAYGEMVSEVYDNLAKRIQSPQTQNFKDAQTIHPLQNSPLVPLIQQYCGAETAFWLGSVLEIRLDLLMGRNSCHSQTEGLTNLKPSQMSRLQRSLARDRISAAARDSTVMVASFLMSVLEILESYLHSNKYGGLNSKGHVKALKSIMQFWWDVYELTSDSNFEDATFQALVAIGNDFSKGLLTSQSSASESAELALSFQYQLQKAFDSGFKLSTGLSMEKLWLQLRPIPFAKRETLQVLIDMEGLATRFDALRWRVSISVPELANIMTSLTNAYKLVLTSDVDGSSLVRELGKELDIIEEGTSKISGIISPFLSMQFEALRQYLALQNVPLDKPEINILSDYPTSSRMTLASASGTSKLMQGIDYAWGRGQGLFPVQNSFVASLLHRLHRVDDVNLNSLRLLETELPIMGHHIACESVLLCKDQVLEINNVVSQLISEAIDAHEIIVLSEHHQALIKRLAFSTKISELQITRAGIANAHDLPHISVPEIGVPTYLQSIIRDKFEPAVIAVAAARCQPENKLKFSSIAWINFALGCMTLYVPDRSFDPDKRQRLERQRHEKIANSLLSKITALRQFENIFSGQNTNLRCQQLEEELEELGTPREALQEIFRPEETELPQLQGEFNNLLSTTFRAKPDEMVLALFASESASECVDAIQGIKLLQDNLVQIIRRLSERFRAYRDMTIPVVGILRCLQIGLSIAGMASANMTPNHMQIMNLSKMTPFMGGSLNRRLNDFHDQPMEFLAQLEAVSTVEGVLSFGPDQRRILFEVFHLCYEQWSKHLAADRKDAESKTGLYRFRGSAEDEEEDDQDQFNELFPSYDGEPSQSDASKPPTQTARESAILLSKVHSEIFLPTGIAEKSVLGLLRQMATRIGALYEDNTAFIAIQMNGALLSGSLLMLNDDLEALKAVSTVGDSYNFYTDANLPETRKLVELIHQIQIRFSILQNIDEISHMQPLEDVMVSCKELLEFKHTEPLAKIITKVEKIHTFMHEWQFGGWASRANSALTLYDSLTATIVNWRRLELTTWSRLFDMENRSCDDDAKSWWFIAYQVVISAPLSRSESEPEMRSYAQELLRDLETYFATAIQGQFMQRLQLLKQLQQHLQLLVLDIPLLSIISTAVANFIELYARYEIPVIENIRKGRQTLEKSMRDVLLLASWKDTNIIALRDSAKRSHHKLFKLVRKYRNLLGQPMEQILNSGLPEEPESLGNGGDVLQKPHLPTVDAAALNVCETLVPHWSGKSKRFLNVSKTVNMMDTASQLPSSAVDASTYVEDFLTNIIGSTAELQKTTPTVLTEENKNLVKHLKSRKRKLFAETLKELRLMGVKHNFGTAALSEQESISIILSNTENVPSKRAGIPLRVDYYYHKTLDMIPRARRAVRQHSEDLSSAEVARSTGILEGLLEMVIRQRNSLAATLTDSLVLDEALKKVQLLWAPDKYEIRNVAIDSNHSTMLRWLPNILKIGLELTRVHSKLGQVESADVQQVFLSWIEKVNILATNWEGLPLLPRNVTSTDQDHLAQQIDDSVKSLCADLASIENDHPDLGYILRQIQPWTEISDSAVRQEQRTGNISKLDLKLSKVCDTVLVAIEKLSRSLADLPSSAEDPAWFVKTDSCLLEQIKVLNNAEIARQVNQAFDDLQSLNLDDANTASAAAAVFAVALPILQQYSRISHHSLMRYAQLHHTTCKMTYILSKIFIQIASQGFCTPSEKSDAQDGKPDKLEGGTGLGDGEGAEDISKDIQEDEDLSELAQEPNQGDKEEIKDEKDAVDMADGEMEGEMGDAEEKGEDEEGSGNEDESEDEMDEEAGDVDDLDPNAVDEKMWDGDGEKAEKDQEGEESKGKASKDELAPAQDNDKQPGDGDEGQEQEEEEEMGAEQSEEVQQEEVEMHDPHAQEGETLELPEDMELDGDEKEGSASGMDEGMDDAMDELSEIEDDKQGVEEVADEGKEDEAENADGQEDQEMGSDLDIPDVDHEDDEGDKTEEAGEKGDAEEDRVSAPEDEEGLLREQTNDAKADAENVVPNDVHGTGQDQEDSPIDNEDASTSKAQREEGSKGGDSSEKSEAAADDGEKGRQANGDAPQSRNEETQDSVEAQPFKKLGDALEKWHRQQAQVQEPPKNQDRSQEQPMEVNGDNSDFQHLQDEDADADAQALGTTTEEQAHTLDESMAIDLESNELPETFQPDEAESDETNKDVEDMDSKDEDEQHDQKAYEGRAGAMIERAKADHNEDVNRTRAQESVKFEEEVEEVDTQLSTTHIQDFSVLAGTRSVSDAREQWTHFESLTRDLSLSLTEQLRLILAPTLATKMRGDFRSGKRLNIKRIIPYIASQYKRDKIWMRRSVPSKRSYQIMLAVDDSKSMGESGSGSLALETLVMVSKSLSMLEVGEICVVGFGENVHVAHDFETPFSSDAGPNIFQNFGFEQSRTDVTKLVRESIELFRTARTKASGGPQDLWQLELIISDGLCHSSEHEPIRRLLREAIEERIMMVFVIVDDVKSKKTGESVMDLKEAKFVKDEITGVSNVKIERYLDTFPFQYYLIVSDVKELPGVLATLLRQWFAEVADSSG